MQKKWTVNLDKVDNKLLTKIAIQIQAAEKEEQEKAQKGA
jgi:hypothetical protein